MVWEKLRLGFSLKNIMLILLTLLSVFATFVSASWEPDFHHDGYMFYPIWRMSLGDFPHRDYWEFKGFLYSLFANLSIPSAEVNLYQVRLLNSALAVACSLVLALILRRLIRADISWILGLLWLATSPAWTFLPSDFPNSTPVDPNYLSLFLLLVGTYLFLNSISTDNVGRGSLCLSALSFGMLPWVQQKGLIFLFCLILMSSLYGIRYRAQVVNLFRLVFLTGIFTVLPLGWIWHHGALEEWFEQIFVDVLILAEGGSPQTNISLLSLIVRQGVFLIMASCFVAIYALLLNKPRNVIPTWARAVLIFGIAISPLLARDEVIDASKDLSIRNWLILIAGWLPNSIWYFSYFACGLVVLIIFAQVFFKNIPGGATANTHFNHPKTKVEPFIFSLGVTSLFYLYPGFGYFWWFAPIALLTVLLFFLRQNTSVPRIRCNVQSILEQSPRTLFAMLVSSLLLFLAAQSVEKFEYINPKLNGMVEFKEDLLIDREKTLKFISDRRNVREFTIAECLDVFILLEFDKESKTNLYHGPLPIRDLKKNFSPYRNIFTCSSDSNTVKIQDSYERLGYEIAGNLLLSDGRNLIHWYRR